MHGADMHAVRAADRGGHGAVRGRGGGPGGARLAARAPAYSNLSAEEHAWFLEHAGARRSPPSSAASQCPERQCPLLPQLLRMHPSRL